MHSENAVSTSTESDTIESKDMKFTVGLGIRKETSQSSTLTQNRMKKLCRWLSPL